LLALALRSLISYGVPRKILALSYWVLVVVWMAVIFSASSDRMSFQHSSRIIGPIVHWLWPSLSEAGVHNIVMGVRKGAHLTEYAILALLVWRALRATEKLREPESESGAGDSGGWPWRRAAQSVVIVLLYASSDEFHQLFVPSRQASILDVLLDTTGGVLGLIFLWGIGRWRKRW